MNKQRLYIMIAAIVGVAATFLPWVNAPFAGPIPGTEGVDGWISLGLFAIAFLLVLVGDRSQELKTSGKIGAIIPACLSGLIAIWKIIYFRQSMSGADNPLAAAFASTGSIGLGLYVIVGAAISIPALGFLLKDPQTKSAK